MKKILFIPLLSFFVLSSCSKDLESIENDSSDSIGNVISELNIPADFNFVTTSEIEIEVEVKSVTDQALSGVKVSFFTKHPDSGGTYLSSGLTNSTGVLNTKIQVPTYLENLFVQVHSVGFANQKTEVVSPNMSLTFGGIPEERSDEYHNRNSNNAIPISDNYYYMGSYNTGGTMGLPHYLESESDNLSQEFLDGVNASLPENKPVPDFNPEYLTSGNELDVVVTDLSDVWVTFVTEGAGYKNALGYYVFDTQNPPANPSEIDSIYVVLPNASLAYSGGELYAGDKVRLGTFQAGKTISWVLFQNAWTGSGTNVNTTKFYSRSDFNTVESDPNMRQHTVQLADFGNQRLLNGFEDQTRSQGSDNDFNDLIFYVSANPWEAIEIGSIPQVTPSTDNDGDGVSNESDDFPDDPLRAIRNTYTGSLAFEDLWPAQGDYDFNDMVIDYEIDHILNGNNLLVDIEADWNVKAVFASFNNGFGVQLKNLPSNNVASVSGLHLTNNIITVNGNNTETNQDKATMIFFDSVVDVIQTSPDNVVSSIISFNNPVSQNLTGYPPYNSFIFVNGDRSKEIHLPGHQPTNLADEQLLGTSYDASNSANGYYYKTSNGLPWAINISESFDFPDEGYPINEAYHFFSNWATSGGNIHKDWYRDLPSNRDASKIH
ncbi:LruC domain-containing protein [Winogradskyella sp. SYSU M77433]|uniref:LruC domain-containing protein n=1 Tax=Winogradskyella sp. SYSU M77433 TaxID=3042722 RepID=UPI002481328F|nr:LruC domain-containing protein [Winogradskyella sp. SYSU M77433]MDH7913332.1 LruC domain-containing protein [Winogradskyella sp. SYSU M77433]